jgi:hypothetical protein
MQSFTAELNVPRSRYFHGRTTPCVRVDGAAQRGTWERERGRRPSSLGRCLLSHSSSLRREEAYGTGLCKSFEQPHRCNTTNNLLAEHIHQQATGSYTLPLVFYITPQRAGITHRVVSQIVQHNMEDLCSELERRFSPA